MQFLATCVLLVACVYGGGGVTKPSGIDQFWTDDYKIFEQVYGKTSDKDIYGATLPASIVIGKHDHKTEASKKNERYLVNYDQNSEAMDSSNYGNRYDNLLTKDSLKLYNKKRINFISYSNFKPISQTNDPETYNYLKHLEELDKEEKIGFPQGVGGFKPYLNYLGPNPEETDAYKSIQEIIDAHEANKGTNHKSVEDKPKYQSSSGKNKVKKPPRIHNDVTKSRCVTGRCRKRGISSYRLRSRPHIRGVKKVIVM